MQVDYQLAIIHGAVSDSGSCRLPLGSVPSIAENSTVRLKHGKSVDAAIPWEIQYRSILKTNSTVSLHWCGRKSKGFGAQVEAAPVTVRVLESMEG